MAVANNQLLLRQLFQKRAAAFASHHLLQGAVENIVGGVHAHFAFPLGREQLVVAFRQLVAHRHLGIVREHSRVHVKRRPVSVGVFVLFCEGALLGRNIFLQMAGFGVVDHR